MNGIIYTRVSSDEQVKGTSLDDQETKCREYCTKNEIGVVAVFREEGASAKSADRKEFLKAINFCAKNKGTVDAFVVLRVDRFARNTEDHFSVRKTLADYKVRLHSVTETIGNNPMEKLMETILAASAEFDNSIRAQRCSGGMLARVKEGVWPWKPPPGYTCGQNKKQGQKKSEPDKPDENVFPIIQKGLKLYATGMYTQTEILEYYRRSKLAQISGLTVNLKLIDRLLTKQLKFYAGILVNNLTEYVEYPGKHVPMITEEEMHRIALIKSGKKITVKKDRTNADFPLKRFVRCAACNHPLTGSSARGNGGTYAYYHCYNPECQFKGKSIAKKTIEERFQVRLKSVKPKEGFLKLFEETVLSKWEKERKSFESASTVQETAIKTLEERKKKISQMREDGEYTAEEFLARKAEVDNELLTTKITLSENRIEQFDIEAVLIYAKNFASTLDVQWFEVSPGTRQRFQKLVFPKGIAHNRENGFQTAPLGLIFELNRQFVASDSSLVDRTGFEPATSSLQMKRSTN
jgi:site-specific DNA recombinase